MSSPYIPKGKVFIQEETLINMADVIRKKTGKTGRLNTNDMALTVDNFKSGAEYLAGSVTELTAEDLSGITEICDYAFAGYKNLKSVTIPDSVKRIGAAAFKDCINLESIIIPDSVIHIGKEAFTNTALYKNPHNWINGSLYIDRCLISGNIGMNTLQVESGTRLIAESAIPNTSNYYQCPLKEIYLPDSVKSLSDNIMEQYLSDVTISLADTIEVIGECALSAASVTLRSTTETPYYVIDNGVLFTADRSQLVRYVSANARYTIPDGVTSIAGGAFKEASNLELTLPATLKYIGKYSFAACRISTLSIPSSVEYIDDYAFQNSSIQSITLSEGVRSIGDYTFYNCESLIGIELPDSVEHIGKYAFGGSEYFYYDSRFKSVKLGNAIKTINEGAFCNTPIETITFPEGIQEIGAKAFWGCQSLETLTLPKSVVQIGEKAFSKCSALRTLNLGDNIEIIANSAFNGCSALEDLTLPSSVIYIGCDAFTGCSQLHSFTIPESITRIEANTFKSCTNLTSLNLGASIEYIATTAMDGCTNISEFSLDKDNKNYCCLDGILFNKDMTELLSYPAAKADITYTIPESVIRIGSGAFQNASKLQEVISGDSLEIIGGQAFINCNSLKNVSIGSGIVTIDQLAFESCTSLESVLFAKSPKYIKDRAFSGCTCLSVISQISEVESIGNYAFSRCSSLTDITLPDTLKNIGGYAFNYCDNLKSITIPDSVTSLLQFSFFCCSSLETVSLGSGITNLGSNIFSGCGNLKNVTIKSGLSIISSDMFHYCGSLTSIELPDSIQIIDNGAFTGSGLNSIKLPESLVTISANAFGGCSSLTSIDIPESVTSIGDMAFLGCESLVRIFIPASVTLLGDDPSGSKHANQMFYNCSRLEEVQVDENNTVYASIDGVLFTKDISKLIYYPSGASRNVYNIPEGVISIQSAAFYDCNSLTSITLPDSVTSIGYGAFQSCTGLKSVTLSDSVTEIGGSAFYYCTNLASITIPNSVTEIGDYAFYECTSLESVTIPDSVTSIGDSAFYGCRGLTSVTIPDSVTSIGGYTFRDCRGLESVEIGNAVTNIGYYAFNCCTSLKSITIPDSVTSINAEAFSDCDGLESIYIGKSLKTLSALFPPYQTLPLARIDISPDNNYLTSEDGVAFSKDMSKLLLYPSKKRASTYTVPETVSMIHCAAFTSCSLQALVLEGNALKQLIDIEGSGYYVSSNLGEVSCIYIKSESLSAEETVALIETYRNADGWRYAYYGDIKSYDEYVEPPVRYMVTFCPGNASLNDGRNFAMLINEGEILTNDDEIYNWPQSEVTSYTWYTDSGCTEIFDIYNTPVTSDMTLYAKSWYTVTFHANGVESWPYDNYQVNVPISNNLLYNAIVEHTDFFNLAINRGWYSDPECTSYNNLDSLYVYGDMDLYLNPGQV